MMPVFAHYGFKPQEVGHHNHFLACSGSFESDFPSIRNVPDSPEKRPGPCFSLAGVGSTAVPPQLTRMSESRSIAIAT